MFCPPCVYPKPARSLAAMSSRISNLSLHASIAQTEILRALQGVADMEAKANKRLADNDQPPLPQSFFSAAEVAAIEEAHAAELAALRPADPEPGSWAAEKRRRADEKAHASVPASPYAAFAAALTKAWASARPLDYCGRHDPGRVGRQTLRDDRNGARGAKAGSGACPALLT